jgi:hypothetical protein
MAYGLFKHDLLRIYTEIGLARYAGDGSIWLRVLCQAWMWHRESRYQDTVDVHGLSR